MFKLLTTLILIICLCSENIIAQKYDLDSLQKIEILKQIEEIYEKDQLYRSIISLGNDDPNIIKKDKELSQTASLEVYIAFKKGVEKTLSESQIDSLWKLQHVYDFENYKAFIDLLNNYGYPSSERLSVKEDKLFLVLLHPPVEIEPDVYLKNMAEVLKPEVLEGRMEAKLFATFYDNIKAKILKEPQLYGTNKSFDPSTMQMASPSIQNIDSTNKARLEIGLPALEKGEFQISKQ